MLRHDSPREGDPSPWGLIDRARPLGPDAVVVSTPSHGGIWVPPHALNAIPETLRKTPYSRNGWFEEDCDWCIPYLALGLHRFEDESGRAEQVLSAAQKTLLLRHGRLAGLLGAKAAVIAREPAINSSAQPDLFAVACVHDAAPLGRGRSPAPSPIAQSRRTAAPDFHALSEEEALALLLERCTLAEEPTLAAQALLACFGGTVRILCSTAPELARVVGEGVAADLKLAHGLVLRALEFEVRKRPLVSSWSAVSAYLRASLTGRSRECFRVLFLDKANQLIADELMGEGTVDHAPVYPREVMRRALELAACSCCLVHNHPSGGAQPSRADIDMTREVIEAGRVIGIAVHDHFLVAGDQVVSFRGLGLI